MGCVEGFVLEQCLGDEFDLVAIFGEDAGGRFVGIVDEVFDFFVNHLRGVAAVIGAAATHVATTEEDRAITFAVFNHTEFVAHAPFADHVASKRGGLTDVARSPVRNVVAIEAFGNAATHGDDEVGERFLLLSRVLISFGEIHGGTQVGAARNDRDLVQRIGVRQDHVEIGVPGFVPSGAYFLLLGHGKASALAAPADLVACLLHFIERHRIESATSGKQSGFVDKVRQFSPREPGSTAGNFGEIHPCGEFDLLDVNAEDFFAPVDVGQGDRDLAVETAGTQQRRIEHVRTVGGSDDDDAFLGVEAVHLDKELIECLFALVVTTAHAMAAMTSNRVDFIDEDQAGRVLAALLKHVADARGTDADKHFHEVGTRDREEWYVSLTRDRASEESLAGSR